MVEIKIKDDTGRDGHRKRERDGRDRDIETDRDQDGGGDDRCRDGGDRETQR